MALDKDRLDAIIDKYMPVFIAGDLHCGEASLVILDEYFGTHSDVAPRVASCFGGGMCGTRHTCGLVTGSLMAIGLKYGREIGGDRALSAERGRRLIEWYIRENGTLECRPLVDFDDNDPDWMTKFRAPGGKHQTYCEPTLRKVMHFVAEHCD